MDGRYTVFPYDFLSKDLFSMISGKEWLDGSNLLMCYSHAGSLVSQETSKDKFHIFVVSECLS